MLEILANPKTFTLSKTKLESSVLASGVNINNITFCNMTESLNIPSPMKAYLNELRETIILSDSHILGSPSTDRDIHAIWKILQEICI